MKRIFLLLLVFASVIFYDSSAYANETLTDENGYVYKEYEDYYAIDDYYGRESILTIPSVFNGKPVTHLSSNSFHWNTKITSVTIPSSVTDIDDYAFQDCYNLETLYIEGNSLQSIGVSAFDSCTSLKSIIIPDSVTEICEEAFSNCSSLEYIYISSPAITFGKDVFEECDKLQTIGPYGSGCNYEFVWTTQIPAYAFSNLTINEIHLPDTITSIGEYAFYKCVFSNNFTLPPSIKELHNYAFGSTQGITEITIPPTVQVLSNSVFSGCSTLKSVIINTSLTELSDGLFSGCHALENITIESPITKIGNSTFSSCTSLKSFEVPDNVVSIGSNAFSSCQNLETISLPQTLKEINQYAFYNCGTLDGIQLPDSLEKLGQGTFASCNKLSSITIPSKIKILWCYTFSSCIQLKEVLFNNSSLEEIDYDVFYNCHSLKEIALPDSVTKLNGHIFERCTNLEKVILPKNIESIYIGCFKDCKKLLTAGPIGSDCNIEFGWDSAIPSYAFYDANYLESVILPDGINSIGHSSFCDCSSLVEIYLPNSLKKIDIYAFGGCSSLESVLYDGNLNEWYALAETLKNTQLENTNATLYLLNPFYDIGKKDYYYDSVLWAFYNNITAGTDATHFSPKASCTRGQAVTFLWRLYGQEEPTISNPFVDIKPGNYYYKAVLWAYENGITAGTDATHFNPEGILTRSQFVTLLWRTQGAPEPNITNPFVDIAEDSYYESAVLWAYENKITAGIDSAHFAPFNNCDRAQIVSFLYRLYGAETEISEDITDTDALAHSDGIVL